MKILKYIGGNGNARCISNRRQTTSWQWSLECPHDVLIERPTVSKTPNVAGVVGGTGKRVSANTKLGGKQVKPRAIPPKPATLASRDTV